MSDSEGVEDYEVNDRLLRYKGKEMVPSVDEVKNKLLSHFYDSKERTFECV